MRTHPLPQVVLTSSKRDHFFFLWGSWYQRLPVRYSDSVRRNIARARFGHRWAQATMIVFNNAIGAT